MSDTRNYARHVGDRELKRKGTGMTVFFGHTPPMAKDEWSEWAFWEIPEGSERGSFRGRLVSEDSDQRAYRLKQRVY